MRHVSDGAKVFIKNDILNKYILILRDNKQNIPHPNKWDIVGGGIEKGESPKDTISREVQEELDIDIYDLEFLSTEHVDLNLNGKQFNVKGHYYIAKTDVIDLSNIHLTEGQAVDYFSIKQMLNLKNTTPVIEKLIKKFSDKIS